MRNYFKPVLFVLGILLITFSCQKDDTQIPEEELQIRSLKAFDLTSREIPTHILNFVKTKTNNNFGVSIVKNKIKLSSSNVNEFSRETPLGTVQTNKVIQVNNEHNTKYTFKVNNATNANNIINLIVVDMDGDIVEYFIQYIFDDFRALHRLESGAIDMSRFTGTMVFYNTTGNPIGVYELTNGVNTYTTGTSDPCNEEEVDYSNSGSNTGGGSGGAPDEEDGGVENSSNGGSSSSGSGNNETIDEADCGIVVTYSTCGNGGTANGHGATGGNCVGSLTTITDTCSGSNYSYYQNRNSASRVIGEDPCAGDVGVLIEEEQLIYDESLDDKPCQREIISDASSSCSPLNQVFLNLFESDNSVNIIFKSSDSIGTANANTSPISDCDSNEVCHITITFRESYLNTASDLAIAGTTIHESMHAILVRMFENGELMSPTGEPLEGYKDLVEAYVDALAGLPANLGVPHHELLGEFIDDMATALSNYDDNSKFFSYYRKLSWSGLTTTDIFLEQYPVYLDPDDEENNPLNYNPEYLEIKLIIQAESFNTTQTFTHPNGNIYEFNPKGYTPNETAPCN